MVPQADPDGVVGRAGAHLWETATGAVLGRLAAIRAADWWQGLRRRLEARWATLDASGQQYVVIVGSFLVTYVVLMILTLAVRLRLARRRAVAPVPPWT